MECTTAKVASPKLRREADGQDQPATGQAFDTLAVQIVDANTVRFTGKKAGKPEFEQTRTVSDEGKTLTVSSTNHPADGSPSFKAESKWARVSKGPAVSMTPLVSGVSRT